MKELVKIDQKSFNQVITKAGDVNELTFKTIDEKLLTEINSFMPIVNKKVASFNKKNSQTTTSLMSLNMVDSAPYRVLRQILAQIERKRTVLKENIYKVEKKKIQYKELQNKVCLTELEELKMKKLACDIIDIQGPVEAALKEIGVLKRHYEEICKNKNIPEDWDESNFEEEEIRHHIISIAKNMIRDRMQGSYNVGSQEYSEQFGIEPILAYSIVDQFIEQVNFGMQNNQMPSIEMRYQFYDKFYNMFKDEYKKAIKRIGIDNIIESDFLMKD